MSEPRPVPEPDETSAPWWRATREGRLTLQKCGSCGQIQHYPRSICTACGGSSLEFVPASGRGTVYSHSTVHRSPHPAFEPPYVVALVRLDEGPVLLTNIVGCDPSDVRCDQQVRVEWEPLSDGRMLPMFTPTES
jgi:hypothetical protein